MSILNIIYLIYIYLYIYSLSVSLTEYSKNYLIHKGYNDTMSTIAYTISFRINNLAEICKSFNGEYVAFLVLFINSDTLRNNYVKAYSRNCPKSFMFNYIFRNSFLPTKDVYQYFVMSYNPISTTDSFNKLIQDIELVSGTKDLISENFLTVYQPMKILRDTYSKIGSFSVEAMMNYLHNLEIKTAEYDGVKLSDSHYYSKGFTILYLPCKSASMMGCMVAGDSTIFINYPAPIYANGYDLTVYLLIIIIIINRYGQMQVKYVIYLHMIQIIFIIVHYILE